ncbi:MAG: condensation domain-containing protein, partial [Bacteroidota bacterium]
MNKDKDSAILLPQQKAQAFHANGSTESEKQVVASTRLQTIHHYWLNKQNGYPPFFNSIEKDKGSDIHTQSMSFPFSTSLSGKILQLGKQKDFNSYKLILANLSILLHHYAHRKEILIAQAPMHLSGLPDEKEAILFSHFQLDAQLTVRQLLKTIHQELEENISHQDYNYPQFISKFANGFHVRTAVLDIALAYDPVCPINESLQSVCLLLNVQRKGDQDFTLQLKDSHGFDQKALEQLARLFLQSLDWICDHLDASLEEWWRALGSFELSLPFVEWRNEETTAATSNLSFPRPRLNYYPLSPPQNRMFLLQHLAENSVTYNVPFHTPFDPKIERAQLQAIFQQLIDRHESLRTSFELLAHQPVQIVHEKVPFEIPLLSATSFAEALQQFIRPFDLRKAPLIRVAYWKKDLECWLFIDQHHIVTDAFSQDVLSNEIASLLQGKTLAPVTLQYKDYVQWLAQPAQLEQLAIEEAYWLATFAEPTPLLDFPLDATRQDTRGFRGATAHFQLNEAEMQGLNQMTSRAACTLNTLLLAIWTIFLAKITGEEDIVVGAPVAGRTHPDLKQIVGMFVNTVPIRNFPKGEKTFVQFLQEVKERVIKGFDHQNYPFERLVEQVWDGKLKGRNPIFDTMFGLLSGADSSTAATEVSDEIVFDQSHQVAKFDMDVSAALQNGRLYFAWNYDTDLYEAASIRQFIGFFRQLIRGACQAPASQIANLSILSEAEHKQIFALNPPTIDFPSGQTIVEQFEGQVR